jgi:N12 class adenine-specific DNA methylase
MAWYDDPNLVNPDSLPQDEVTGINPALPAAPVAVRPSPFAAINQQLEQNLQQMQQPRGLQAFPPMGPTYTPEEWAALQAQGKPAADAPRTYAPRTYAPLTGLKVLGNELAPSNLWTQGKAAVARLAEDSDPFENNNWADQWRNDAKIKDEENRKYAAEQAKAAADPGTQAYFMPGVKVEEVGGLGSNLAFSAAGMAGTIGGRAAGAATGAAIGSAVGTPGVGTVAGGIIGGLFGGGAMAYKQQQVMFLEQLHDHLNQQSLKENNKPLDPEVWKKTFSDPEIQAAMQDSALWEAGPEAVGNMLFLKLGKMGFSRNLSDGAWKKALKATGAVVANAAQEQGTETVTQMGQSNAEVRAGMRPESERRSWTSGSDWGKSSDEVFAQTLLLSGVMGGAGGAISKAHEALIQNPRDAANLVDLAADPNIREALPTEALGNLATLGQWLQSRKLVSNDQLPGVVNALQAEWAARQNESPEITSQREAYLANLYASAPDDSPIKSTLNELWNGEKKEKLPGWVRWLDDSTDYGLRGEFNKDGTPTGNINLQGLSQLKPTLDIAGMGLRGARTRTLQDQINQANFEGEFDPAAGDVVDDQDRVWKRDPNTNTLTLAPIPTTPAGLNTVTPVVPSTPAAPAAPIIKPEPADNLTPDELSAHQAALNRISKVKQGTKEYAREIAVLDYYSKPGTKPSETWNKKPEQPGLNTLTPTPPSQPSSQSETAPALPPTPHPEPVIVGGTPVESVKQGVTDLLNRQKQQLADLAAKAAQPPAAPAPTPTPPTPALPDTTPAASSPVSAPSQDSLSAPVVGDAGSVAQSPDNQQIVSPWNLLSESLGGKVADNEVHQARIGNPMPNELLGNVLKNSPIKDAKDYAKSVIGNYRHLMVGSSGVGDTLTSGELADKIAENYDLSNPKNYVAYSALKQYPEIIIPNPLLDNPAQRKPRVRKPTPTPAPAATGPAIQPTTENQNDSRSQEAKTEALLDQKTPASQEAGGKKEPWEMTREEAAKDYPGDEYDKMLTHAAMMGEMSYQELEKRSRYRTKDSKFIWAQTRKEVEQSNKKAIKEAKEDRAFTKKTLTDSKTSPWRIRSTDIQKKAAIETAIKQGEEYLREHKRIVQEALSEGKPVPPEVLSEGKPVPPEVLADYPDLQQSNVASPQETTPEVAKQPAVSVYGEAGSNDEGVATSKPKSNKKLKVPAWKQWEGMTNEQRIELLESVKFGPNAKTFVEKLGYSQLGSKIKARIEQKLRDRETGSNDEGVAGDAGEVAPIKKAPTKGGLEKWAKIILPKVKQDRLDEMLRTVDKNSEQYPLIEAEQARRKAVVDQEAKPAAPEAAQESKPEPTLFPKDGTPAEKIAYLKTIPENNRNNEYRRAVSAALVEQLNLDLPEGWKAAFNSEKHQYTLTDPKGVVHRTFNAPTVGNGTLSSWLDTATKLSEESKSAKPEPIESPRQAAERQFSEYQKEAAAIMADLADAGASEFQQKQISRDIYKKFDDVPKVATVENIDLSLERLRKNAQATKDDIAREKADNEKQAKEDYAAGRDARIVGKPRSDAPQKEYFHAMGSSKYPNEDWLIGWNEADRVIQDGENGKDAAKQSPLASDITKVSEDDFAALIAEVQAELKGETKPEPPAKTATPKATKVAPGVTVIELPVGAATPKVQATELPPSLANAAKEFGQGAAEAFNGMFELFGGKSKLSSGLTFDEDSYQKAIPHFKKALQHVIASGKELKDFIRFSLQNFGDGIVPYLSRFHADLSKGVITLEDTQDVNPPAASTTPADDQAGVAGSKPGEVQGSGTTGNATGVSDGASGTDAGSDGNIGRLQSGSDDSISANPAGQGRSGVLAPTAGELLEPNPSGLPELPKRFYEDYRLPVGGLERTGSWAETAKRNVDILELATKITQENRPATPEEQELLVKYVGFGAGEIRNKLFPPATPDELEEYPNANQRIIPKIAENHLPFSMGSAEKARWVDLATRLSNLLSPEDQKTLLRSTQYAHYTSESIIRSIWAAMAQFGFNGGTIMEPGMGIGSFAMAMPEGIARNSRYMGIEMDGPTAMVAKLLLPLQVVNHADFTKQAVPNDLFDAAIGNPPFAKTVILSDPKYAAAKFKLHDYFFAKTIDSVRPGGLLVFVTSRYTMDKQNTRARKYLAERADFMGAIRLPQTAFRDNAGTDVVTDVIFLRKKILGQNTTGLDWTTLAPLATKDGDVQVNEYFAAHPEMILGQPRLTGNTDDQGRRINGLHPGDLTVVSYDSSPADLEAKFAQAITNLPSNIYSTAGQDAYTLRGATAQRDFAPKTNREGALYQDKNGALMRVENGVGVPLSALEPGLKDKSLPFVKDYIDLLAKIRSAKMSQWEDGNWQEELDKLNAAYDAFRKNHGPLLDFTVQRRVHSDLKTVWADLTQDERAEVIQLAGLSISPNQTWDKTFKAETKRAIADAMSNRDELPTSIRDALGRVIPEEEALISDSKKFKNKSLLSLDSDAAIVYAIETINEKGEIVKSPFLKGRTIRQPQQRSVNSPQDALAVSLDKKGFLDLADVATQMQTTEDDAIKQLGDLLYQTPTGQWQLADEYLSGDVVTKLAEAVLAAKQNPALERNIKALEKVQPLPKGIGDISANLGAGWIDAHYVEDFAREALNLSTNITYDPVTATWIVHEAGGAGSRNARGTAHDWGILNIKTPHEILAAALSGGRIIISNTIRSGNTTTTVRDEDNTVLANDLVKRMREEFKRWVWTNPDRVQDLTANYNEKHNRLAGRKFDGSHLTLPGLSLRYPSIHPHQLRAIWRIIQTGNTYAAHAVGAGKTLEMIIAGMEQRRLGLIQRPVYVVPNHMLEQFSSEFMDAYPTANIMVADKENFQGDVRQRFVARAALNNPDAIILTHSSFKLIGMNEAAIAPIRDQILSDIQDALRDIGTGQETRVLRSRLEQQLEQAEQRFDKMLGEKRDTAITFDELGADFIFYDEAHAARKLDFTTNLQLKGVDPQGSFQALDLYIKTRWLESQHKGRSFVFASGTPVTNTMGELYSLMRFFDEEALRQAGVHTFDAWAAMFGEVALEYEPDAQGVLQPVERFSKFNNLPALMSRVRSFMDILTSSQLRDVVKGIPKIEGNNQPQMVDVQKSPALAAYMQDVLGPRLADSRAWKPSKEEPGNPDPIMAINQAGLLASIDLRFTNPSLPNDPSSKLNKMIDEIIADHQDIADLEYVDRDGNPMAIKGGTQIVFYNVGFGAGVLKRRGFDARAWVNRRLRDAGIPADEVAWFDDANDDAKKERIFQDMRSGKIKVLFGSAKKMGTGVNVQNRLKVLHYLDPPWYPSDVEQPFGRILRQGNQNPTVRIKTYGTVGTYEASQWGILARKMRFIEQALSGDNALNSMEDISAASMYEQAAAIVAGDPRFKVLADLTNRIKQLEALRSAHQQGQGNLVGKKRSLEWNIENGEKRIDHFKQAESILGGLAQRALFERGEVNGQRFTKRGEFGEELAKEVNKRLDEDFSGYHKPVQIAKINNILPVMLETDGTLGSGGYIRAIVYVKVGEITWEIFWGSSTNSGGHKMVPSEAGDKVGSALHKVGNTTSVREKEELELVDVREELKNTTAMIGQPFAEERALADMIVERNRLLQELSQAAPQQPTPADDRLIAIAEAAKQHQDQAKKIALYDTPTDYVNRLLAQIPGMRGEQARAEQERKPSKSANSRPQFSIAAEDSPTLSSAYALGETKPSLTPLEVLAMVESGGTVSNAEWEILQAYLSGVFAQTPALGVDAPSFKEWFGKSKIVSKKTGQPIKMYHATGADFTEFDLERSGKGTSHPTAAMGFFFTNDRGHAATKYGDNVMEVYLAIERPYLMTDADLRRIDGVEEAKAFREKLIAQGYDGIVMPNETSTRYVAAFYPDQIKLTNNETYTRGVKDIRRSVGQGQATGLTQSGFVAALKRAFPYLSEAIDKVLARGLRGEKGGTVLIDSNDPNEIARVYAEKTGITFAQALKELNSDSPNLIKDQQSRLQGWYSPRAGLVFAILPNLSAQSAPAVFLHETGHGQQRDDITRRAVDLITQRTTLKGPQLRAFLDRVNARLAAAGLINKDGVLTDENEAATYIIEQAVLEGKQNGFNYVDGKFMDWVDAKIGKPVGDLIRKLVNFIRAAMLRRGFPLNINKLTVDDLVSFAKIGVEKAARGDVRIVGQVSKTRTGEKNVRGNNILDQAIRVIFGENTASEPVLFAASVASNSNDAVNQGRNGLSALASNPSNGVDLVQPGNYLPLIGREVGAVRVDSFRTGISRVTTPQQAAALMSPISRQAQEFVMALVTDAKGKPLAVIRHSVGTITRSQVDQKVLIGSILNVPNAAQVWFAHNHPSADAAQSKNDNKLSLDLDILMRGSGISNKGMLVVAANQSASWVNPATMEEQFFDKTIPMGTRPVPVLDRQFVLFEEGITINRESEQVEFVKQFSDPGAVLLDGDGVALAWVPISNAEMSKLRTGNTDSGASRLLKIIERTNSEGALIKVDNLDRDKQAVRNLMKFFNAAGITNVPARDNNGQSFDDRNVPEDQVIFKSYAGPNTKTADQSLLQQAKARVESGEDVAPQFSIAPTQSPAELERISNAVDEAGGWATDRETEKTILDRLRGVWDKTGDVVQDSRKMWVKLLTRQQLVELISHIPGVGPLAQSFEKTARNLDAMKQELKQMVYPVAERWRDGIVRSRDNGYLLSKIIHASTLHGVDPLGVAPIETGNTPQERAELADKLRWHGLVKQWLAELESKDPTLAKVYKESRDNYELMREERYGALMARIGRSGNSMVRSLLDKAEQGVDEAEQEALIAQLRDLKTADAQQYNKVRGAILSAFPQLRPKAKPGTAPSKPLNEARALLDSAGKKAFDALVKYLQDHTVPGEALGPVAKTRYNRLFGQADRLAKEAANPAVKGYGRRLAGLFESDPAAFQALRDALVGYLKEPGALLTIADVAHPKKPGKTKKEVVLTDLANSPAYQAALQALPKAAQGLFTETLESAQSRMADHSSTVQSFYETTVLRGPYAPLSRFGDYQVYAEKDGQPLPIYATFESPSEQLRAVKALKEEGWKVSVGYQIEDSIINTPPSGSFIGSLFGMIEETVASEQEQAILKDDVYQLYLHSLPDMSASKHFVHRKGIPGFSQDALRAYAQLMNQSANAIARLNFSDILQEQLQDMSKEVERIGQDSTDENIGYVNQAAPVVSELHSSYNWLMNPTNATWANRLTSLGFFWYLTNFSTSLVNLTQTPLMTFPDLAARYGAGPAFKVLYKTIKDYGNWKFRYGESKKRVIDAIGQRFDGDMKRMLDHIEKSGAVSRTETVMLADMGGDVAEFQTSKPMVALNKIKSVLSWPFQKSEVANREIAAIAAYTLARNSEKAKAMTPEQAHQYAQDVAYNVVFRTQNDYSNANKASFMRNDFTRVIFLFKSYAQMMTWRWLRDVHQMFKAKGVDPETAWIDPQTGKQMGMELKTIARQRVKWMLASSFMFSGAMGLPIYAMTMGIASLIAALGSDPDDPWDVETEVNQAIQAAALALTHNENSADVLRRLVMTGPTGTLFGIDLSPRVSMDVLRLWLRKAPDNKEGEDYGLWLLQQAAGPVAGGMGVGAVKGLNDLSNAWQQRDGTLASRGLETMLPAPLRNVLKTLRYHSEGVTTRRGDKIVDDPTALDLVRQFVGFTPAEIADQYERNAAVKELDRDLSQRRNNLVNRWVYALEQEDQVKADSALEAISEFSIKNPQIAISGNTLSQSYRGRQRAKLLSENGLYIPSKGMRARLEGEGY